MLKLSNISIIFAYLVSAAALVFGILMVSGLVFKYAPDQLRITAGVVMILLGIYRFFLTRMKSKQQKEEEE